MHRGGDSEILRLVVYFAKLTKDIWREWISAEANPAPNLLLLARLPQENYLHAQLNTEIYFPCWMKGQDDGEFLALAGRWSLEHSPQVPAGHLSTS